MIAAVALLAAPLGAPQEKPPVFEAGVEVVALDVSVVDSEGRPVPDLGPDEFRLSVDGRPRPVVSAEFVAQTGEAAAPPAPAPFPTSPP